MSRQDPLETRVEKALHNAGDAGISVLELLHQLEGEIERNDLRSILKKMTRAGAAVRLERDFYAKPSAHAKITGRLEYKGGHYCVRDNGNIYVVSPEHLGDVIAGDVVRIAPSGNQKHGRPRAVIVDVVRQAPRETFALIAKAGRYLIGRAPAIGEPILVVDENARAGGGDIEIVGRSGRKKRSGGKIQLPLRPLMGQMVNRRAKRRQEEETAGQERQQTSVLTAREAYRYVRRGELHVENLLDQLARGVGVDGEFSRDGLAVAQRAKAPQGLRPGDVDLRDEYLVTIDGETAKDFDDAVCAKRLEDGTIELLVAIADVSFYVPVDSGLDMDAKSRGSSVYLPGRVYPMLPERLSNELCSLMPNVDRYCAWVRMRLSDDGDIQWYDLGFGLMRSAARLTYKQVQEHLDGQTQLQDENIAASIEALNVVYHRLHQKRMARGMLDFSLEESNIVCSDDGERVEGVQFQPRWDSHRLIEECMLATNETVADFLNREDWPCIYRSHEAPDEDKLNSAFAFAQSVGVDIERRETARSIDEIAALVEALHGNPAERVANFMILRSMKKAEYSVSTDGHFGIGASRYAHFTSPIRRYADLEVHRVLRHALAIDRAPAAQYRQLKEHLRQGAQAANQGEARAVSAERFADRLLKARWMVDHVGEEFDTIITGVQDFGIFVSIVEFDIEGLVPVNSLPGKDFYVLNEHLQQLEGRRSRRKFRLGQELRVQCMSVDVSQARVNFEITALSDEDVAYDNHDSDFDIGPDDDLSFLYDDELD